MSGAASGEDTKGIDAVCTGKPRSRISHEHGEENVWIPTFEEFKADPGILRPSEPIDNRMKAWGSIIVTNISPLYKKL